MKQLKEGFNDYLHNITRIILWAFIGTAVFIFTLHAIMAITYPYPLDYGEAPLVDQAQRLAAGENIYRADLSQPPYTIANYPPLYVLFLTPFAHTAPFQIGRLISVLAAAGSAVFLGLILYHFSQNRLASWAAGAMFLAMPYVVHWSGMARIDMLALLLATAGLYVLVRNGRYSLLGSGILLIAAAYTRQSYALAAPLAAIAWLWAQDRQKAIKLAGIVAGGGLALFLLLTLLTGGGFYFHIITANVNEITSERIWQGLQDVGRTLPLAILLALILLIGGWRKVSAWWLLAGFLLGAFISTLTYGKIGSNVNYFLEITAALSLTAGMVLAWSQNHVWQRAIVMVLIALQTGIGLLATMDMAVDNRLTPRLIDADAVQRVEQYLGKTEGTVLVDEYMGLLTLQDRPLYLQPFEMSQLANDGQWNQQPLINDILNQQFPAILIHHFGPFPVHRERWTPEMLAAIDDAYTPSQTMAGTVIYTPKIGTEITAVPPAATATFPANLTPTAPSLISQSPHLYQPAIAVNPILPGEMAVIATAGPAATFSTFDRNTTLLLYTSSDGGLTWAEQTAFSGPPRPTTSGSLAFAADGSLYVMGIRGGEIVLDSSIREMGYDLSPTPQIPVTRVQVAARPRLQFNPANGNLYISLDAQLNSLHDTPAFIQSDNGGQLWSLLTRADQQVAIADFDNGRASWPESIYLLLGAGDNLALVWVWDTEPWIWPRDVWLSTSADGGETMSPPTRIGETWGPISAAANNNGRYALTLRTGTENEQQLVVAVSEDNGRSWHSTLASANIPLTFDVEQSPALSMAENGTVDVIFYAADSADCSPSLEEWRYAARFSYNNTCTYNLYYSYSPDGGQSFSQPTALNTAPIQGDAWPVVDGRSQSGSPTLASLNEAAYAAWIDGGQVYMSQIER
ncbi:MAG: exo-alpha-sialidase [Ardenticatenaceae bacterium]|nr:exo-alpha-sialidase [Ardenticatenaceae bacterium]